MMRQYKVWWKKRPYPGNFGDILTPKILEYFRVPFEYSDDYNLISTGSIAKKAQDGTIVLGSGMLSSIEDLCPTADWRFVRGPLTRKRIIELGGSCPEIYGDPALLLPLMVSENKKTYDVILIPHYTEYQIVEKKYPKIPKIHLLNSDPLSIAKSITKARKVISSSLHGIIVAHAFGIPAARVEFGGRIKGNGFKFNDYYSSIGLNSELSTMNNLKFTTCDVNFNSLIDIFKSL